jgi:hypothetical protein
MTEINWIKDTHEYVYNILIKFISDDLVNIVADYCGGFVFIGTLFDDVFKKRKITESYTTTQIRYINKMYFIDFWNTHHYDWGGDMFTRNWFIDHYTYIYKNGTLLRDKIRFVIDSEPSDIKHFNPSYPIYNMSKLKQEHYVEFNCTPLTIQLINNNDIRDINQHNNEIGILGLFNVLYNLTEKKPDVFYENHKLFNL